MTKIKLTFSFLLILCFAACNAQPAVKQKQQPADSVAPIMVGAQRLDVLLPMLANKRVALLVNQTAMVGETHLVDTFKSNGVNIVRIFAPEHGFRGSADAGEHVKDSVDPKTKIRIVSLYGDKKKPSGEDLKGIDVMLFDIQDVGARFYTFISSLHYLMEACAESKIPLIVLDRPNPNGWYVDGPVLQKEYQSFVGVDEIPVVHGLTVGEYAQMVNGEKWLWDSVVCPLTVIKCLNYDHTMRYSLPVKPSPNLPNDVAVYLYPSLCFFEGTQVSIGRGTDGPLQMYGAPQISDTAFSFVPLRKPGAKNPPHLGKVCYGYDLRKASTKAPGINLGYLLNAYAKFKGTEEFFLTNNFFDKLAGSNDLRKQIIMHQPEAEIKASWQAPLNKYKSKRKKYLLYKDFE